jgi:BirA family transcriptional regulator, biotin operon repressor / biotin---[acetyl-CoA-carboxylase] ligase
VNFPSWLHYLATCESTNTWALDRSGDLQHGDVVFTPKQTAGRGQQGRVWLSPAGVITASLVLMDLELARSSGLSIIAGLAAIEAILDLVPALADSVKLKWPNDLLINDRKLAGILCESRISSRSATMTTIVGMGLNLSANWDELPSDRSPGIRPISLSEVSNSIPSELDLLSAWRDRLLGAIELLACQPIEDGIEIFLSRIDRFNPFIEKSIELETSTEKIRGTVKGIDRRGRLILQTESEKTISCSTGRIKLD